MSCICPHTKRLQRASSKVSPNSQWIAKFPDQTLHPSNLVLKTYTEDRIRVMGTLNMRVQYGEQGKKLVLVVVGGNAPSLLVCNWLRHLKLDWKSIVAV